MLQSWCDLSFLHWRYPVDAVRARVPGELELDLFERSAWVGVTPLIVRDLRPVLMPALPWISTFPETNCRTYVKGPDATPGVWFFSLDGPWPLFSAEARALRQAPTAATAGLPDPGGPPLVDYSPGVRVRVSGPQPV